MADVKKIEYITWKIKLRKSQKVEDKDKGGKRYFEGRSNYLAYE